MGYSNVRRFVAGAVCPRCSELDKLVVYSEMEKDYRECVSCGFKEEMRLNIAASELQTRVNQIDQDPVQVIKLMDGDKN